MKIPSIKAMNLASIVKNETLVIRLLVTVCGLILAGVLIGLSLYGMDLAAIFLGTPWNSPLQHTRGIIALEGVIVAVTLVLGGLFIAGIMALIKKT